MNQLEVKFWKYIKDHLPGDVIRVENAADPGTPDVNGCIEGREYWIELKVCTNKIKVVKPESTLKDSQIVWHLNRGLQKGSIFLLIRYPMQKMILLYDYVIHNKKGSAIWTSNLGGYIDNGKALEVIMYRNYKLIKQFSIPLNKKLFREIISQNA